MTTPKDNTEVLQMLKEVKKSIFKSLTPMKPIEYNLEYINSLKNSLSRKNSNPPSIATRLNFSNFDDSGPVCKTPAGPSGFKSTETPESLKRKLVNTEMELQASKAKLKKQESIVSDMEPTNKKIRLDLENKLEELRKQNEMDSATIIHLQVQLRSSLQKASNLRILNSELEQEKRKELDRMELRLMSVQRECGDLKDEVASIRSEKTELIRKFNMEIGKLELKISMMEEEAKKSKGYIDSLKRQNNEMVEKVSLCKSYETELKEAQDRIQNLENKIEAEKDAALIVASRQADLKTLSELQKENLLLREEVDKNKETNVMLFQEQMWSLQEKLNQAEKKCSALAQTQAENEILKSKLSEWESLFDDKSTPYKSPSAFSRKLSQYQQTEATLTSKLATLSSRCEALEKSKKDLQGVIANQEQRVLQLQQSIGEQEVVVKRLRRKILFLSKEKENQRKLLDSYLSEATISGVSLHADQINQLEQLNADYKKALENSEKEIDQLQTKLLTANSSGSPGLLTVQLQELSEKNRSLESKIAELETERANLQKPAATSQHEPAETRVLHLRFNPLDVANRRHLEVHRRLQEENDALKKRVQVLEEEGAAAADVTMKVQQKLETEGADSTLQGLRDQLSSAERKQKLIIDNARKKSMEFREAVYQLIGYRIDIPMDQTYKLSHIYADSRDDYLLFKINKQGIQLVETEYSKQLTEKMDTYLLQHDSFPAFLSSLTMDLFNQQTFLQSSQ